MRLLQPSLAALVLAARWAGAAGTASRIDACPPYNGVVTPTGRGFPHPTTCLDDEQVRAASVRYDGKHGLGRAEFEEADLRRVPGHLVRRDPATQVIVTRERAMRGEWRGLDLSRTPWAVGIEFMLERGDRDVALVAPKRDRKYRDLLDGLKRLRDAGVAEPD